MIEKRKRNPRGEKCGLRALATRFSTDGRRLVAVHRRGTLAEKSEVLVQVWGIRRGKAIQTYLLSAEGFGTLAATLSADATRVATLDLNGVIRVWDVATRKRIFARKLLGPLPSLTASIRLAPDGETIITLIGGNLIKTWAVRSGEESLSVLIPDDLQMIAGSPYAPLGFDTAAKWFYLATEEKIALFDALSGDVQQIISCNDKIVRVAVAPDGDRIVIGTENGAVQVWETATGELIQTLQGHSARVGGVAFGPRGERIVTSSVDGTIRLWEVASREPLAILLGHDDDVVSVCLSPDGAQFASAGTDGTVKIWDADVSKRPPMLSAFDGRLRGPPTLSADGRRLAFATGKTLTICDSSTGSEISTFDAKLSVDDLEEVIGELNSAQLLCFALSKNTGLVAVGTRRSITFWDADTDVVERRIEFASNEPMRSICFSPSGNRVACLFVPFFAFTPPSLHVWDVATGEELLAQELDAGAAFALFTSDGSAIALSMSNEIQVIDADNGTKRLTLEIPPELRTPAFFNGGPIALSPDGSQIAAGIIRAVLLWDIRTGERLHTLRGHKGMVMSVGYSPDGQRLVTTANDDVAVKVWDTRAGVEVLTLENPEPAWVTFTPDGERILSIWSNGAIKTWIGEKQPARLDAAE